MVKSLAAIAAALLILTGLAVFEHLYTRESFDAFGAELQTLYQKADAEEATESDAEAVRLAWEARKEKLHIVLPHGDVNRFDDVLSEAVRLIAEREYALALPKLEVLIHLAETLPSSYAPSLANIF